MASVPKLKGLNCPKCGASLEVRSFGHAMNIVCPSCLSVLDATDPNLKILQRYESASRFPMAIPLGKRGALGGIQYEAIGFQVRGSQEDSSDRWREYLLFNPYYGFRYLTESDGHWNFVRTLQALPKPVSQGRVEFGGEMYMRYSGSNAATIFVLGEFPWQVRVGDFAQVADYVHAPRVLSSESTAEETVWSLGAYMTGAEVWAAFGLPGAAPGAVGIGENQPAPANSGNLWPLSLAMVAAACMIWLLLYAASSRQQVYGQTFDLKVPSAVTEQFEVKGHSSNLQVLTKNIGDESVYLRYALVSAGTGRAREFAREVHVSDTATIPNVPAGRYYLRAEADHVPAHFDILVKRDVPSGGFVWITLVLILAPPVFQSIRRMSFERQRWQGNE